MAQASVRPGDPGDPDDHQPHLPAPNAYAELLRTPGGPAFSAAAFVGRMPMSMYGLGTVLLISMLTGRYGAAGTVAAAGSVGYALCGPIVAKLADQRGQRRVLVPELVIFAASASAFVACAQLRAPFWTLLVTGVVSGASVPPLGSMVRARWSYAAGSAVGGLWYGSRRWRAGLGKRFTVALACAVCGFSAYWAMPGLAVLAGAGFLASLAVAPALSAGYAIQEGQAERNRRTEGMAWLGSTISVGVAGGSALVGRIIDAHGSRWGLSAAAAAGVLALIVCLAGAGRLATARPRDLPGRPGRDVRRWLTAGRIAR